MKIYSIFKYLPTLLPKRIGSILNSFITSLIINYLKSDGDQLWVRNSIALGYDEFLKSDIDLTLITSNPQKSKTLKKYLSLKKFCPLLQEINVYKRSNIQEYYKYFNTCELLRDPTFSRNYPRDNKATAAEKIVFLSRMIHSNKKVKIRNRKFSYYKKLLLIDNPSTDISEIFKELYSSQTKNCIQSFLESQKKKSKIEDRNELVLFPNMWIVKSMGEKHEIDELLDHYTVNKEEMDIIRAALCWELHGLITQNYSVTNSRKLEDYINAIIEFCEYYDFTELEQGFSKFLKDLDDSSLSKTLSPR
ncbi:hypothetical protein [Halobacteriovorax sp. HLS]|uniref:hypothetical protein n=1 Tax=Halobacteriovorax sp. HLS TaxID=2234000 RepID=UPI000FD9CBD3|nr:hypothetical protein [Halobacteriovorax sp. HLS]